MHATNAKTSLHNYSVLLEPPTLKLLATLDSCACLRNELDFWNVHGILNTSGLLQLGLHLINFARDPKYSWIHEHSKNWIYCFYLHFIIYLLYKK